MGVVAAGTGFFASAACCFFAHAPRVDKTEDDCQVVETHLHYPTGDETHDLDPDRAGFGDRVRRPQARSAEAEAEPPVQAANKPTPRSADSRSTISRSELYADQAKQAYYPAIKLAKQLVELETKIYGDDAREVGYAQASTSPGCT